MTDVKFDLQSYLRDFQSDLSTRIDDGFTGVHERLDKLNGRVRSLEQWRSFLLGGWALTMLILTTYLAVKH